MGVCEMNPRPKPSFWLQKALSDRAEEFFNSEVREQAEIFLQPKLLFDVIASPGRIQGRLKLSLGKTCHPSIGITPLSESVWGEVARRAGVQALFPATILCGSLPAELLDVFKSLELDFLPSSSEIEFFQCECLGRASTLPCAHTAALFIRFAELSADDPFSFLLLRGLGKDSFLNSLLESRRALWNSEHSSGTEEPVAEILPVAEKELPFDAGILEALHFDIRADELPGTELRRLDTPPVPPFEEEFLSSLEELYDRTARRAQALGMRRRTLPPQTQKRPEG